MRKRILTMTVAAVTVIAAMTGCNKKDAGSVDTTKQNTVTDAETTTAAETTTEVGTTTEAETTTEYSIENDPYFDMENAVPSNTTGKPSYCLIDGDTYMAITGAECIAENVPITTDTLHGTYSELHYYGHNEKISCSELQNGDEFNADVIRKIYTVPEQPYIERKDSYIPVVWMGETEIPFNTYASTNCVRFLCEFDLDGRTTWQLCAKSDLELEYGVDINDYIDFKAYARTIVGVTPQTE